MGELRRIPGIGAVGERDLLELGYTTIQSLAGADPEEMYARECARKGVGWTAACCMSTAARSITRPPRSRTRRS